MSMLAFDMNRQNHASRRFEFRGRNNADYYDGELIPLTVDNLDMRIEKSYAGDYPIYRLSSHSSLGFRRTWHHIRQDKTCLTVFWFVRRGAVTVRQPGKDFVTKANEFTLTRSSRPFYMEITPDDDGALEVLHIVIPSHRVHSVISDNLDAGTSFPAVVGEVALAKRVLWMLFEEGGRIDSEVSEQIVEALLKGIGKTILRSIGDLNAQRTVADRRLNDILAYIKKNFSNADLHTSMVADDCGISLRYFCHILKKNELSFSSYLWNLRLDAACKWLADKNMRYHSISEIAYMSGFKSSAHFSRMFKGAYKKTPREFRLTQFEVM